MDSLIASFSVDQNETAWFVVDKWTVSNRLNPGELLITIRFHSNCVFPVDIPVEIAKRSLDLRRRHRMYRARAIAWRASACIAFGDAFPLSEVLRGNVPELKTRSDYI